MWETFVYCFSSTTEILSGAKQEVSNGVEITIVYSFTIFSENPTKICKTKLHADLVSICVPLVVWY